VSEITNSKHPAKKPAGRQITNKFQISSTRLQINPPQPGKFQNYKLQYSINKTFQDEVLFGISNFGHWKLFDICDLIFVIFELQTK